MNELTQLKEKLNRVSAELTVLYEISNAMRTTLKLDEILYIILTGVTAHVGLGFNRAMLFLVNEKESVIEGRIGIGPHTGEEANSIWAQIDHQKMDLEDLINAYKLMNKDIDSQFNDLVNDIRVPLNDKTNSILAMSVLDGMPIHLSPQTIGNYTNDPLLKIFHIEEMAVVPMQAKDKVIGVILADNAFTKKPITKDDMRMLIMLANQAGLAIENSMLYEQTLVMSRTDSLTGLWNHGYFQSRLHTELEKAKTDNTALSVMMIDIDDFKIYNDTLGHQLGDKILKELARTIKGYSRNMDYVCRYGGEEFAIIMSQTTKKEAFAIGEKLREIIERQPFPHEEILPNKRLTVSIGISAYPEDGTTASSLIDYSDKLLYKAKHKGKNIIYY
ncbi:MAG: sensor domain-containing diguanylate cyclase [Candidatus Omnitrophica bacterium]|nr:sensor domain-containing diguanylate cyclase [Candidatus Omnitrophota bacterium]